MVPRQQSRAEPPDLACGLLDASLPTAQGVSPASDDHINLTTAEVSKLPVIVTPITNAAQVN
jgi:hypothetical protein